MQIERDCNDKTRPQGGGNASFTALELIRMKQPVFEYEGIFSFLVHVYFSLYLQEEAPHRG